MSIVGSSEKLILLRMRGQAPDLVQVASHHFMEAQLKGSLDDAVAGRAYQKLSTSLRYCAGGAEVIG